MDSYTEIGSSTSIKKAVHAPGLSATFYGDLVVVIIGHKRKTKTIIGTYSMWLACQSVVESHEGALLYSPICDLYQKYPDVSLYKEVSEFLRVERQDLFTHCNEVARIWKAPWR